MPLMPKRVKHRKVQRRSRKGTATGGTDLTFGEYGLKALSRGWVRSTQIEACRVAINRHMKRKGKLWIRVFPWKPVSSKPLETRMGKGKGEPDFWTAVVKPGTIIYELGGISEDLARQAFNRIAHKMKVRCRMVLRSHKV